MYDLTLRINSVCVLHVCCEVWARRDILIEEPIRGGLSRLSITGSGEPTSCALVATKQLLPNGPQRTHLRISRTELPVGMADILNFGCFFCFVFRFGPSEGVEESSSPRLWFTSCNRLHDCMGKLNVNSWHAAVRQWSYCSDYDSTCSLLVQLNSTCVGRWYRWPHLWCRALHTDVVFRHNRPLLKY